jgi:hypothetical protein
MDNCDDLVMRIELEHQAIELANKGVMLPLTVLRRSACRRTAANAHRQLC